MRVCGNGLLFARRLGPRHWRWNLHSRPLPQDASGVRVRGGDRVGDRVRGTYDHYRKPHLQDEVRATVRVS